MQWERVTWPQFVKQLHAYRANSYEGKPGEEKHYIQLRRNLESNPRQTNPKRVEAIHAFLNHWNCRFSLKDAPPTLETWLRSSKGQLMTFQGMSILDGGFRAELDRIQRVYDSLIALKSSQPTGIHNMSDAAASKILHALIPDLFVMWDRNIAPHFSRSYRSFLERMHAFACRLQRIAPPDCDGNIEAYLNATLQNPIQKTLAKYIDEYNWQLIVRGNGR